MVMADRDRWIEELTCPECGATGNAELSTADAGSWTVRVDSIPEGFKVIQSEHGSSFYCTLCEIPALP
jgi:hypothetical protein